MDNDIIQTPSDNNDGQEVITEKTPGPVPYARFQEVIQSKNDLESKLSEKDALLAEKDAEVQRVKLETEMTYAKQMYGESVDDASVQEYKLKYPELTYPQIFGALGIEVPPTSQGYTGTPGRTSVAQNMTPTTISRDDLSSMQMNNPAQYKSIMEKIVSREIQIV